MKKNVLVAYATNSGSTAKVAETIGDELRRAQLQVVVCPIKDVKNVQVYDMVVIGGPMISGWHVDARQFFVDHQDTLSRIPVACFFTALKMAQFSQPAFDGVAIFQDPGLVRLPAPQGKPSQKQKIFSVEKYLGTLLVQAPRVRPVGAGFFAGKLDLSKLPLVKRVMVQTFIGVEPGDYRNWQAIRDWASTLISISPFVPVPMALEEEAAILV